MLRPVNENGNSSIERQPQTKAEKHRSASAEENGKTMTTTEQRGGRPERKTFIPFQFRLFSFCPQRFFSLLILAPKSLLLLSGPGLDLFVGRSIRPNPCVTGPFGHKFRKFIHSIDLMKLAIGTNNVTLPQIAKAMINATAKLPT